MRLNVNELTENKPRTGLVALALAGLMALGACGAAEDAQDQAALAKSRAAWNRARDAASGNYRYDVNHSSFFGAMSTTRISVAANRVTKREYHSSFEGTTPIATDWVETGGGEVGTHEEGAAPVTIDALYDRCRTDVLPRDRGRNDLILLFRTDGILDTCVYTPRDCADDCASGVWVSTLEF